MTPFAIDGLRTMITGGTAGIGHGIARHFVDNGAAVVVTGRRAEGATIASAMSAAFVSMDVASMSSVDQAVAQVIDTLGGLDVAILNAGIDLETGTVDHLDIEAFHKVIDVNLIGVARCISAVTPHLDPGATIIVTGSPAGRVSMPGISAYAASKAGVDMLVRTAAIELGPSGVRVNAVLPGIVRSEMSGGGTGDGEAIRLLTQTGTMRDPEDLGPVYQFLASSASATVTGAMIEADDGISAGLSAALLDRAFAPDEPA